MKTKNSSSAPKDSTQGLIRYCCIYVHFPDGETWSDYVHIAGGLNAWVQNTKLFRSQPEAASKLLKTGEYHRKVKHIVRGKVGYVTERMVITDTPCERRWGLNKKVKRITNSFMRGKQ